MARSAKREALAVALRRAIADAGLSLTELGRRGGVAPAQLSRFVRGERDLTVVVASRVCLVLGWELVRTGEVLPDVLPNPPKSTRGRADGGKERGDAGGAKRPAEGRAGSGKGRSTRGRGGEGSRP